MKEIEEIEAEEEGNIEIDRKWLMESSAMRAMPKHERANIFAHIACLHSEIANLKKKISHLKSKTP